MTQNLLFDIMTLYINIQKFMSQKTIIYIGYQKIYIKNLVIPGSTNILLLFHYVNKIVHQRIKFSYMYSFLINIHIQILVHPKT